MADSPAEMVKYYVEMAKADRATNCNKVGWEKCVGCEFLENLSCVNGGVVLRCKITGDAFHLTDCIKEARE